MLKEHVLIGSYYSYTQYKYFFTVILSLYITVFKGKGKHVAGKGGGRITTRSWERTGEGGKQRGR